MGVQAIFGPSDPVLGSHIHSICDALDIPFFDGRAVSNSKNHHENEPFTAEKDLIENSRENRTALPINPRTKEYQEFVINLNPAPSNTNKALIDVVRFLNWTKFAILYERNIG